MRRSMLSPARRSLARTHRLLFLVVPVLLLGCGGAGRSTSVPSGGACAGVPDRVDACLLRMREAVPPRRAQVRKSEGLVDLRFDVSASGAVTNVSVAASVGHPLFETRAIRLLEEARFAPAMREGQPVPAIDQEITIPFRLVWNEPGASKGKRGKLIRAAVAIRRNEVERARALLARMDEWDWPNLYEAMSRSMLRGMVLHLEGRSAEAIPMLEAATRMDGELTSPAIHRRALVWLARAALLADDDEKVDAALAKIAELEAPRRDRWPRDIQAIRRLREADREVRAAVERNREGRGEGREIEIEPAS